VQEVFGFVNPSGLKKRPESWFSLAGFWVIIVGRIGVITEDPRSARASCGGSDLREAQSVYVLVAIVRKRLGLEASLYQILQILSVTLFEKTPILRALQASDFENDLGDSGNQLNLFDF